MGGAADVVKAALRPQTFETAAHLLEESIAAMRAGLRLGSDPVLDSSEALAPGLKLGRGAGLSRTVSSVVTAGSEKAKSGIDDFFTKGSIALPADMLAIPSFSVIRKAGVNDVMSPFYKVVPASSEAARVFTGYKDSTVNIALDGKSRGTGFFADDGRLVGTANHVVNDPEAVYSVRLPNNEVVPARLVGRDEAADIALLKLDDAAGVHTPVELVRGADVAIGSRVFSISRSRHGLAMTDGHLGRVYQEPSVNLSLKLEAGAVTNIVRLGYTNETIGGTSGSGLFTSEAKVLGVHTHGQRVFGLSEGTGAEHVSALIASVRKETPFVGWLSQNSRAMFAPRHTGEGKVVSQLEGVVPTSYNITNIVRKVTPTNPAALEAIVPVEPK
jgi:S1-C subfamily serine protease